MNGSEKISKDLVRISNKVTKSTELNFGQVGNAFQNTNAPITPPTGKVIIAITMLNDTAFTAMAAEDIAGSESFALSAGNTGSGSGGTVILNTTVFPKGMSIYGRWTSVTPEANSTGGIICYFGA